MLFYQCHLEVHIHHHHARIKAKLRKAGRVGIIVDRVGKHGAKRVGRVPLGSHPRSTLNLAWDLRVNGKPLKAGRYHVTLRALDKKGKVLGLSAPVTVRIGG